MKQVKLVSQGHNQLSQDLEVELRNRLVGLLKSVEVQ